MKLWRGPKDDERLSLALVETLRSRVKLRGRPQKRQRADGFYACVAYLSPLERKTLMEIAAANSLSQSKVIRTLIRMYRTTKIDGMETP